MSFWFHITLTKEWNLKNSKVKERHGILFLNLDFLVCMLIFRHKIYIKWKIWTDVQKYPYLYDLKELLNFCYRSSNGRKAGKLDKSNKTNVLVCYVEAQKSFLPTDCLVFAWNQYFLWRPRYKRWITTAAHTTLLSYLKIFDLFYGDSKVKTISYCQSKERFYSREKGLRMAY